MRIYVLATIVLSTLLSACSVSTSNNDTAFKQQARWGLLPVVNYSEKQEQISCRRFSQRKFGMAMR